MRNTLPRGAESFSERNSETDSRRFTEDYCNLLTVEKHEEEAEIRNRGSHIRFVPAQWGHDDLNSAMIYKG
jgi:hypothetical protein